MTKITIIVKSCNDISAIKSLLQQTNNLWECIIINNSIPNIEQIIANDKRFKIINNTSIYDAIKDSTGDYILLINSDDILVSDAIDDILRVIHFTDSDVIKINSRFLSDNSGHTDNDRLNFKYVFNKENIVNLVFENISEFCFKKEIIHTNTQSEHALLTNILAHAKDLTKIDTIGIIHQHANKISIDDFIENFHENYSKFPQGFWIEYFKNISPKIIAITATTNDKKSFIKFCNNIPIKFIPWRYRIMCYILKKTNK